MISRRTSEATTLVRLSTGHFPRVWKGTLLRLRLPRYARLRKSFSWWGQVLMRESRKMMLHVYRMWLPDSTLRRSCPQFCLCRGWNRLSIRHLRRSPLNSYRSLAWIVLPTRHKNHRHLNIRLLIVRIRNDNATRGRILGSKLSGVMRTRIPWRIQRHKLLARTNT